VTFTSTFTTLSLDAFDDLAYKTTFEVAYKTAVGTAAGVASEQVQIYPSPNQAPQSSSIHLFSSTQALTLVAFNAGGDHELLRGLRGGGIVHPGDG
jgi:hypothetical protein